MSYEFKKLSEVQALTEVPEGAKVLAEANGQIVRVPGNGLGGGTGGVQPDWNENDETSKAYILNRPFYEDKLLTVTYRLVESEGKTIEYVWYKVSDSVPNIDAANVKMVEVWLNGQPGASGIQEASEDGYYTDELLVVVALKDNYTILNGEEAIVFPERGTFFISVVGIATATGIAESGASEPEISWDMNPGTIKKIDEKFIPEMTNIILKSSTADSTKRFKITVDDSGTLSATEVTN